MFYGSVFTGTALHDRSYSSPEPAEWTSPRKTDPNSNHPAHLHRGIDHRPRVHDNPGCSFRLRFQHENLAINQGEEPLPL